MDMMKHKKPEAQHKIHCCAPGFLIHWYPGFCPSRHNICFTRNMVYPGFCHTAVVGKKYLHFRISVIAAAVLSCALAFRCE
jgi:hypothetical protein